MSMVGRTLRIAGALLGAGSLAALAFAGHMVEIPGTASGEDVIHTVQIPAGETVLVCAPAPALADTGVDVDDEFAQVTDEAITAREAVSLPRGTVDAAHATIEELRAEPEALTRIVEIAEHSGTNTDSASILTVEPAGDEAGLAAGTALWSLRGGDLRSISASGCQLPASDHWLVGGSGEIGHTSTLTLTNPSHTTATIDVTLYGPLGVLDTPLLQSIVVAPESSMEILLGAHTDVDDLAAHVTSSGADVAATISHAAIDGLTPHGFDIVTPSAAPTSELVIPGAALADPTADDDDAAIAAEGSAVRVVNPNDEPAIITVTLLDSEGESVLPGADDVEISPSAVYEVSLDGLPDVDGAIRIDSDQAVTAGAVITRGDTERDQTWIPATARTELAVGAVTDAERLLVTALADDEVFVYQWDANGYLVSERSAPVTAGTTIGFEIERATAVMVTSSTGVVSAVVYEDLDGSLISVMPLTADTNEQHAVDVRVVN